MTRRRLTAVGFPVVLVAMLVVNLLTLGRNAESRPYRRTSDSMFAAARDSSVHSSFGVYHYLRRLEGKTLILPPDLQEHVWFLKRISRLNVVVADAPFELPVRQVRRIRRSADRALWLRVSGRQLRELYFFQSTDSDRFVVAQAPEGGSYLIMSEPSYRSLPADPRSE